MRNNGGEVGGAGQREIRKAERQMDKKGRKKEKNGNLGRGKRMDKKVGGILKGN